MKSSHRDDRFPALASTDKINTRELRAAVSQAAQGLYLNFRDL